MKLETAVTRNQQVSIGAGCAMLLCCACSDEPTPWWEAEPDFEWQGNYVTIMGRDRQEADACGESLVATDDYVAALIDFHGVDAPVQVDFDWFSPSAWDELLPCSDAYACTGAGRVASRELVVAHELAHAVSWDVGGNCNNVLEEGLAEYLSDPSPMVLDEVEFDKDIEDILVGSTQYGILREDYRHAGHFVSFLIEDHGIDAVHGLCDALRFHADLDDWDSATRSVLSLPLADVLADYAAYPICQHHAYRARLGDCAGGAHFTVSPHEETSFSLRLACDEPDAIGERGGMVTIVKRVHASIPGWYDIGIEGNDDVTLVLEQCAPCSEEPYVRDVERPLPPVASPACVWIDSPTECNARELSGTHLFIFFLPADQVREVIVTIQPTSMALD